MEAQQTYNATLWMTKSLPSTTKGGCSLRKPTSNSHSVLSFSCQRNQPPHV